MIGIEMDELLEWLTHCHEAVFHFHEKEYVLQPEVRDTGTYEVIWCLAPPAQCVGEVPIPPCGDIPADCLQEIMNLPCLDGKSFNEAEAEITVDIIF